MAEIDWTSLKGATRALCGKTFFHYDDDGKIYQGIVAETCGYEVGGPEKRKHMFFEPPGTIVLWPYRGGRITNIAAHDYESPGLVEIRKVLKGKDEIGPLKFTKDFKLGKREGARIKKTRGDIYIAETPGLKEQGLYAVNVLDLEDHPDHRVSHWRLERK